MFAELFADGARFRRGDSLYNGQRGGEQEMYCAYDTVGNIVSSASQARYLLVCSRR